MVSFTQNERTLRGGGGCSKTSKGEQGGREGSKLGNLERTYFLNVPLTNFNQSNKNMTNIDVIKGNYDGSNFTVC